jgi:hypothetical protein
MEAVKKIIEKASDPLIVAIPEEYKDRRVEVTVRAIDESEEEPPKKYDFSKFVGKLEWNGDAVAEQRRLRDEWD